MRIDEYIPRDEIALIEKLKNKSWPEKDEIVGEYENGKQKV